MKPTTLKAIVFSVIFFSGAILINSSSELPFDIFGIGLLLITIMTGILAGINTALLMSGQHKEHDRI